MPDPLLYGKTLVAAALAGLLLGLASRRGVRLWPADYDLVAGVVGTALAIVVGFAVAAGFVFTMINLAVDLALGVIDPRIGRR